jgi:hypothetical protein
MHDVSRFDRSRDHRAFDFHSLCGCRRIIGTAAQVGNPVSPGSTGMGRLCGVVPGGGMPAYDFALRAGIAEYRGDFVAHYLVPVIYQEGLPPKWQLLLAVTVVVLNLLVYLSLLFGNRKSKIIRA